MRTVPRGGAEVTENLASRLGTLLHGTTDPDFAPLRDLVAALTHVDRAQKVYRPGFFVNVRPCPKDVPSLRHFVRGDLTYEIDQGDGGTIARSQTASTSGRPSGAFPRSRRSSTRRLQSRRTCFKKVLFPAVCDRA